MLIMIYLHFLCAYHRSFYIRPDSFVGNTLSQHTHTEPFSRSYAHDTQQAAINFIRTQPNPVLNLQRLQR